MATDPVCGMYVEEGPGALRLDRDNRTYFFCCPDCRRSFAAPEAARRRLAGRLAVAWPLSVVILILTWAAPASPGPWLAAALAAVVQAYPGAGFYAGAFEAVRRRVGNMDLLIAVGSTAAFGYSLAVLVAPGRLPPTTYFDASSLIVTVILTGTYLESLTRRRASSALRSLGELLPSLALRLEPDGERNVPVGELRVGDRVRVPAGARVPVDGIVREGRTALEEALLTGESMPVLRGPGERVIAGAHNLEGPILVEATATGPDTFVARVGALLEEAELGRVPLQREADRLAAAFVPVVLAVAGAAGAFWFFAGGTSWTLGLLVFVAVAVTACPCAFGLATPAALLVGTGRAAEEGILFRGGDAIERAARVDTVLLDKTGTLTAGTPELVDLPTAPPLAEAEALAVAAGLEAGVWHPLARAVLDAARARGLTPATLEEVTLLPGVGVRGREGGTVWELRRGEGPRGVPDPLRAAANRAEARGRAWSLLRRDGRPVALLAFRAAPAVGAAEAVRELTASGYRLAMVTGDQPGAAQAVARELGIGEVHAAVTPAGKVSLVERFQAEGHRVAFVGDGVNDAAALAAADVGIAVGSGAEVAREAGQVLLVQPDLRGAPRALGWARGIVRRVGGNLAWAVGYNAVLLPIAAGALIPFLGPGIYRYLPILGAVAMGLSSTTVLLGSLTVAPRARAVPRVPPAGHRRPEPSLETV